MSQELSRRFVLGAGAVALAGCATGGSGSGGGAIGRTPSLTRLGYRSPNEKLVIAAIGAGGKGAVDIAGCAGETVAALCDVDWNRAAPTFAKFPDARRYRDFREMLDKEKLDAVTISTPDHTHAVIASWAMQRGVHVYVQKPLTHKVAEGRRLLELARKHKVATQMGNQGHSGEGSRQLCEMIWSGAIGAVKEVHAWTNRPIWPQGLAGPLPAAPVPADLAWDLFLGPAAPRAFNPEYHPFKWRGWYDFGCGALGDMACHLLDAANWALELDAPTSVECLRQEGRTDQSFPTKSIVKYEFPARGARPAVSVFWYDGGLLPPVPEGIGSDTKLGDGLARISICMRCPP